MIRRILVIVTVVLASQAVAPASGEDFDGGLDPAISGIAQGGLWQHEGETGRYRVVIFTGGSEHLHSRAYLQWLRSKQGTLLEDLTIPVIEINQAVATVVTNVRVEKESSLAWVFKLEGANPYTGDPKEILLWPLGKGKYRITGE